MGSIDDNTWLLLNVAVLTVLGLVVSGLLWRSRGAASGVRGLAWSLVPGAAYLTGTLDLLVDVGSAVSTWAVQFVFSPVVWLGVVLAGGSATLFVASSLMRRRGVGAAPAGTARGDRKALATSPGAAPAQAPRPAGDPADDDMDDIEAILRKHGIT